MNIEELKAVLDLVSHAANGAQTFAMLWLAKGALEILLYYGLGLTAAVLLVRTVRYIADKVSSTYNSEEKIAQLAGLCTPLYRGDWDEIARRLVMNAPAKDKP